MTIVAIVPVAHMKAANDALAGVGANNQNRFGPSNFSVPAYGGTGVTHAALHAWDDPAFLAAIKLLPNVIVDDGTREEGQPPASPDPITRTRDLIEAQGAKWGAQAPALPTTGNATANTLYKFTDGTLWWCIQTFSRSTYGAHPSTYPALIRRIRDPRKAEAWRQPLDQYDSYKLVNPFTNAPDACTHAGKNWRTRVDVNVWEPASGQLWDEIDAEGNVIVPVAPPVEEWPAWKPWTGINADLYQVGAKVSHAGKRWVGNTPNNHWTPGEYGWTQQP